MNAYFNRFTIKMTKEQAFNTAHQGDCYDAACRLLKAPAIRRQLAKIPAELIAAELKEYGGWSKNELKNHDENLSRIVWIAAGNIKEEVQSRR